MEFTRIVSATVFTGRSLHLSEVSAEMELRLRSSARNTNSVTDPHCSNNAPCSCHDTEIMRIFQSLRQKIHRKHLVFVCSSISKFVFWAAIENQFEKFKATQIDKL